MKTESDIKELVEQKKKELEVLLQEHTKETAELQEKTNQRQRQVTHLEGQIFALQALIPPPAEAPASQDAEPA